MRLWTGTAAALALAAALVWAGAAGAVTSGGSTSQGATINGTKYNFGSTGWSLDPKFHKQEVAYTTTEPPGTIIISTRKRFLYYVLGNGKALRYGIGVGRYGFTWQGQEKVTRKAEWPDWHPPKEMRERDPTVPEFMKGGPGNPLGARALYLGNTEYRIHGTAQPWTIGTSVSSGCIRLTNEDVSDLYERVKVGAKVIVQ
jgi:lipoprotein-anchoring transpeptidase ErfK/SrfK